MDNQQVLDMAIADLMYPADVNAADSPVFYSSVLFAHKHIFTEECPTAGIDGYNLFLNPDFFGQLRRPERVGLLAHECMHPILRHNVDFKTFNLRQFDDRIEHYLWNCAGDHVINLLLRRAGYSLPDGGLWDSRFEGMDTIQVYHILHEEFEEEQDSVPDDWEGDVIIPEDDGSAAAERDHGALADHITKVVGRAALQSELSGEDPGSIPGEARRLLQKALNPQLPFEVILANYMNSYNQDDYSWTKPNRRFLHQDIYLPGFHSPCLNEIAVAFDTSASVSHKELSSFGSGVRMIQEMLKPKKMTLIEFDTVLHGEPKEITPQTFIEDITLHGGGGTDVTPVFKWVNENKPEVILIFTDGGFHMPDIEVASDIIWIINDNPNWTTNNGVVFHYNLEDCR